MGGSAEHHPPDPRPQKGIQSPRHADSSTYMQHFSTGADVIFDPVGGPAFDEAMKAAAPWGAKYLVIGFAAGSIPKVRGVLI